MAKKYKLTQDGPEVQALLNKIDGIRANQTPGQGVEPIPMENLALDGVLYAFLTTAVSNLLHYYTKSETYTKAEVNSMVAAIKQFTIQSVESLPQPPSADTMNILYLVPAEEPKVENEKDEFITVIKDGSYAWEQVGSTAIDLSGYVTTEALNAALADYVTDDALATALAGLNDVKYTPQSLTDSQKAQARTNIGATAPEIFWAEYGVTTLSEITTAYNSGEAVLCLRQGALYVISKLEASFCYFTCVNRTTSQYLLLNGQTSWSAGLSSLQTTGNLSQSVETDKDSTAKYPSTKAVFDSIGKWGVISQTQTWTGRTATGFDYTMSNQVWGLIPQANIDLYVSAGAVFNESTGYFELNGLTDISYQEMMDIYSAPHMIPTGSAWDRRYIYRKNLRTNIPYITETAIGSMGTGGAVSMFLSSSIETIVFGYFSKSHTTLAPSIILLGINYMFGGCTHLKSIKRLYMTTSVNSQVLTSAFSNCNSLETIELYRLGKDVSFSQSPRLNLPSIVLMVDNAVNTSAITITLHADAFARCQADTTEYTYNGQTYTGIIAYASAKNITIASA